MGRKPSSEIMRRSRGNWILKYQQWGLWDWLSLLVIFVGHTLVAAGWHYCETCGIFSVLWIMINYRLYLLFCIFKSVIHCGQGMIKYDKMNHQIKHYLVKWFWHFRSKWNAESLWTIMIRSHLKCVGFIGHSDGYIIEGFN